jgi:acetyl/propionyl-CoA carboxylase alpha subunit
LMLLQVSLDAIAYTAAGRVQVERHVRGWRHMRAMVMAFQSGNLPMLGHRL